MTQKECCLTVTEEDQARARDRSRRKFDTDLFSQFACSEREGIAQVFESWESWHLSRRDVMWYTAVLRGKASGMERVLKVWKSGVPIEDAKNMLLNYKRNDEEVDEVLGY